MNITFILPGSGRSGGIKSTVRAANGLLQRGYEVRLLVNKSYGGLRTQLRKLWLKVYYPHSSDWINLFEGTVERFCDIEQCAFEDREIVIATGYWAAEQLRRVKLPGIVKVHNIRGIDFENIEQMSAAWGENVPKIAVGSYLEKVIQEACGQKLVAVIPNGIDTKEYYPSVPGNLRNGIGTIYGMGYHKDPKTILSVLKKLRQGCPETPQRIFSAHRRPREIPRGIYYRLPSLGKTREIYSRSLVWIMASRSEGLPNPVFEAMACGCAVVATDCGGPRDIIVDGENGFLVEVGNVEQIVDRVKLLLDDSKLRQRFVEKSRETVSKFSWDNSVGKLEEVLIKLAGNRCDNGEK